MVVGFGEARLHEGHTQPGVRAAIGQHRALSVRGDESHHGAGRRVDDLELGRDVGPTKRLGEDVAAGVLTGGADVADLVAARAHGDGEVGAAPRRASP